MLTKTQTSRWRLGRFRLLHRVGSGDREEVWLANEADRTDGPLVVIKVLRVAHEKHESAIAPILKDVRSVMRLEHENLARVLDVEYAHHIYYQVMEPIQGESLSSLVRKLGASKQTVPARLAARIVADVCAGLHHVHENRDPDGQPVPIIHRDISAHRIMLTYKGTVKLMDFGVAQVCRYLAAYESSHSKPTQWATEQDMERGHDIFALGVVLWELLVGRRLGEPSARKFATDERRTVGPLIPPSWVADVPPALEIILTRAVAVNPEERFATAAQMKAALEDFLDHTGPVQPQEVADWLNHAIFLNLHESAEPQLTEVCAMQGARRQYRCATISNKYPDGLSDTEVKELLAPVYVKGGPSRIAADTAPSALLAERRHEERLTRNAKAMEWSWVSGLIDAIPCLTNPEDMHGYRPVSSGDRLFKMGLVCFLLSAAVVEWAWVWSAFQ